MTKKKVKRVYLKEGCGPLIINGTPHNSLDVEHMKKQYRVDVEMEVDDAGLLVKWVDSKTKKEEHNWEPTGNYRGVKFINEPAAAQSK